VDVRTGAILTLAEDQYQYGVGKITIRVVEVLGESQDRQWIWARAIERLWNGSETVEPREIWIKRRTSPA
jgi:hypothetical protein